MKLGFTYFRNIQRRCLFKLWLPISLRT